MCFGLLLIVNDIGDARETLPSPLWLKNKVMVRKADGKRHQYDVWAFKCSHESKHPSPTAGWLMDMIRRMVRDESGDVVTVFGYIKGRSLKRMDLEKWQSDYGTAWQSHFEGQGGQPITRDLWLLSKTGEVNLTKFKQDKRAAIAKFLAKSVEGGDKGSFFDFGVITLKRELKQQDAYRLSFRKFLCGIELQSSV